MEIGERSEQPMKPVPMITSIPDLAPSTFF